MPLDFNFQAPNRPFVNAPTGAFSDLADTLEKKYNEGELITEQAKELFGTLETTADDQITRNGLADEVSTGINQLVGDYKGAYESKQFQRDARSYIRRMATDPRIKAMQDTLAEKKREDQLLWDVKASGKSSPIAIGEVKPAQTVLNQETGQWEPYKSPYETGMDWRADARDHLGKFTPEAGNFKPMIETLTNGILNVPTLKTGEYSRVEDQDVINRANEVVNSFAYSTQGGHQLARNIANQLGVSLIDENGGVNADVKKQLAAYLVETGGENVFSQTQHNWQILPEYLGKQKDDTTGIVPYDKTPTLNVPIDVKATLGFNNNSWLTKGVSAAFNFLKGPKGHQLYGEELTQYEDAINNMIDSPQEKEGYTKFIKEVASRVLFKDIDPNSEEARKFTKEYFKAVKEREVMSDVYLFERQGEEGRSRREDATKDMQSHWTSAAFFDYDSGEQLSEKEARKLNKDEAAVTGIISPKNPVTSMTNNQAFSNAYYVETKDGKRYLMTMPEYKQNTSAIVNNAVYNTILQAPGVKSKMKNEVVKQLGYKDIEIRQNMGQNPDGTLFLQDEYDLWLDGERVTKDDVPFSFNSPDAIFNTILSFKKSQ